MARASRGASRDWDAPLSLCRLLVPLVIDFDGDGNVAVDVDANGPSSALAYWAVELSDDGGAHWGIVDGAGPDTLEDIDGLLVSVDHADGRLFRMVLRGTGDPFCAVDVVSNVLDGA